MTIPRERNIYGRRSGRPLKDSQKQRLEGLLPQVAVELSDVKHGLDPRTVFASSIQEIWLEIGIGGGEHLAYQARHNRSTGLIGAEFFINGIAKTLAYVDGENLDNIRLQHGDARELLDALTDDCLDRAFILFPDPWRKKRHNFRRIVNKETLDHMARILKVGSELRIATDHFDYLSWILRFCQQHPNLEWQAEHRSDWIDPPEDWITTRYQEKAIREDRVPAFLSYKIVK
jgi:tRNA (guanine-N7-)-methyltransferase